MPSDQLVLVYQGREKPFEALWYHFNTSDTCEGAVEDLNGDGRDEVVELDLDPLQIAVALRCAAQDQIVDLS